MFHQFKEAVGAIKILQRDSFASVGMGQFSRVAARLPLTGCDSQHSQIT